MGTTQLERTRTDCRTHRSSLTSVASWSLKITTTSFCQSLEQCGLLFARFRAPDAAVSRAQAPGLRQQRWDDEHLGPRLRERREQLVDLHDDEHSVRLLNDKAPNPGRVLREDLHVEDVVSNELQCRDRQSRQCLRDAVDDGDDLLHELVCRLVQCKTSGTARQL